MMQVYLLSGKNFYRQIQANPGSHWALDLPVATGEKAQPLLGTLGCCSTLVFFWVRVWKTACDQECLGPLRVLLLQTLSLGFCCCCCCCSCFLCCLASVARLTYFACYLEFYISEWWAKQKAKVCYHFPTPYEIWENKASFSVGTLRSATSRS